MRAFPDDRRLRTRRGLLDRLLDRRGDLRRAGMVGLPWGMGQIGTVIQSDKTLFDGLRYYCRVGTVALVVPETPQIHVSSGTTTSRHSSPSRTSTSAGASCLNSKPFVHVCTPSQHFFTFP